MRALSSQADAPRISRPPNCLPRQGNEPTRLRLKNTHDSPANGCHAPHDPKIHEGTQLIKIRPPSQSQKTRVLHRRSKQPPVLYIKLRTHHHTHPHLQTHGILRQRYTLPQPILDQQELGQSEQSLKNHLGGQDVRQEVQQSHRFLKS
jgi:hypothetical protein